MLSKPSTKRRYRRKHLLEGQWAPQPPSGTKNTTFPPLIQPRDPQGTHVSRIAKAPWRLSSCTCMAHDNYERAVLEADDTIWGASDAIDKMIMQRILGLAKVTPKPRTRGEQVLEWNTRMNCSSLSAETMIMAIHLLDEALCLPPSVENSIPLDTSFCINKSSFWPTQPVVTNKIKPPKAKHTTFNPAAYLAFRDSREQAAKRNGVEKTTKPAYQLSIPEVTLPVTPPKGQHPLTIAKKAQTPEKSSGDTASTSEPPHAPFQRVKRLKEIHRKVKERERTLNKDQDEDDADDDDWRREFTRGLRSMPPYYSEEEQESIARQLLRSATANGGYRFMKKGGKLVLCRTEEDADAGTKTKVSSASSTSSHKSTGPSSFPSPHPSRTPSSSYRHHTPIPTPTPTKNTDDTYPFEIQNGKLVLCAPEPDARPLPPPTRASKRQSHTEKLKASTAGFTIRKTDNNGRMRLFGPDGAEVIRYQRPPTARDAARAKFAHESRTAAGDTFRTSLSASLASIAASLAGISTSLHSGGLTGRGRR